MASIHITIEDTPQGTVKIDSDFQPKPGTTCSPAQAAALDIVNRTRKSWAINSLETVRAKVQAVEVDIDAVHRTRDNVINAGAGRKKP